MHLHPTGIEMMKHWYTPKQGLSEGSLLPFLWYGLLLQIFGWDWVWEQQSVGESQAPTGIYILNKNFSNEDLKYKN